MNPEQLADLFSVIRSRSDRQGRRDVAIFALAYHRGLRASEVGRLRLRDFRIKAKRIYVDRLKGGNAGEYRLVEDEVKALRTWLRIRGNRPGPLFPSRNGKPISRQRLDELMKEYGEAAALPRELCHFHCLRHSCATSLLSEQGVDVAEVQDHLGHTDIRSTMVYAKITSKRRDQLGERLARDWKVGR